MTHKTLRYITLAALVISPLSAYAYLDPGTVSYFIQALVAIVAGVGYAVKLFWSQIKRFFDRMFGSKKSDGDPSRDA